MAQQYDEQIQHVAEGERILTADDGCTIVQTAVGAVALTANARIALGPATHAACCWRDAQPRACAVALTDDQADQGSPRHRVAFLTTKGLVDTVECGPSVAPFSHVVGAAFRAGDSSYMSLGCLQATCLEGYRAESASGACRRPSETLLNLLSAVFGDGLIVAGEEVL